MDDDRALLQRYVGERSEEAFRTLVARHIDVIHGAVLRQLRGDAHLAQDVVQRVFVALARKAPALREQPALVGWLYTAARLEAARAVRTEARRRKREQAALHMNSLHDDPAVPADWKGLGPLLDDAMAQLSAADREAVLLRFFSGRTFPELARVFAVGEDAARKRVDRALEKLRLALARRGFAAGAGGLGAAIAQHASAAAPPALLHAVAAQAWTEVAAGSAARLALLMSLNKIGAGVAGVIVALATGVIVHDLGVQREIERELAEAYSPAAGEKGRAPVTSGSAAAAAADPAGRPVVSASAAPAAAKAVPAAPASSSIFADPEYQRLVLRRSLARHRQQFQRLYRQLGLSPAQIERFEEVMAIQDQANLDATVLKEQGRDPQVVYRQSGAEWSGEMKALLGDSGFAQLEDYLRTMPVRAFVDSLAGHAAAIGEPLAPAQADRLAEAALANDATYRSGKGTDPGTVNWAAVWPAAEKILSAGQLATFQAMVTVWTGQKELQRATSAAARGGSG